LLNTGKSDQETAQQTAQVQNENNSEWWMRVLTLALVGVGFLQLIAFIVQAIRLKETIGVMHDTGERQLRAYISITPGLVIEQDDANNIRFEFQPWIKNTGQTPAYEVKYSARSVISTYPLPDDFTFPVVGTGVYTSSSVLGSGEQLFAVIAADSMYATAELAAIKAPGNRRIWVYGTVEYTDVFEKKRSTKFCFFILWRGISGPAWMRYGRHNDAQ